MPAFRYVPILKFKEGEEGGLSFLNAQQKQGVEPLILLMNPQYKPKKETKKRSAISASDLFAYRIKQCWGTQKFLLDASDIPTPANSYHPLGDIINSTFAIGMTIVPATTLGAPLGYRNMVQQIVSHQKNGVALRVNLQEFTSTSSWVSSWPYAPSETDLIVDLADTAPTVGKLGAVVQHEFASLHLGSQWRSVTVAGTSMPANFSSLGQGLHTIPRDELTIWNNIHGGLPYRLDFGDYATPPISEIASGIAYGFPINVRYSLIDSFLICKGVVTRGFGSQPQGPQLIGHANSIRSYANRSRLSGCWADDEIDQIANGKSPQTLGHWVTIGVNRHICITRSVLP